jgi:NADH:ubiquinone oxidoreductase subunit K
VKPYATYLTGQIFAIFIITVAAAEAAVALAMVIAIYRKRSTVDVSEINMMKW